MSNAHAHWLRLAAEEIRKAGHNGWGNTCEQAADYIDRQSARDEAVDAELEALRADAERAKQLAGWSWIRSVMCQGADIRSDYLAGKYLTYEEYSARLDCAAAEREGELHAAIDAARAAT